MLSYSEYDAVRSQSFRPGGQNRLSGFISLKHCKTLSVESLTSVVLEAFHRHRISVIDSGYEGRTFYIESHEVVSIRTKISFGINYLNGHIA